MDYVTENKQLHDYLRGLVLPSVRDNLDLLEARANDEH